MHQTMTMRSIEVYTVRTVRSSRIFLPRRYSTRFVYSDPVSRICDTADNCCSKLDIFNTPLNSFKLF